MGVTGSLKSRRISLGADSSTDDGAGVDESNWACADTGEAQKSPATSAVMRSKNWRTFRIVIIPSILLA
jgi:hypothetical protein